MPLTGAVSSAFIVGNCCSASSRCRVARLQPKVMDVSIGDKILGRHSRIADNCHAQVQDHEEPGNCNRSGTVVYALYLRGTY
jgi:hypothetical protein